MFCEWQFYLSSVSSLPLTRLIKSTTDIFAFHVWPEEIDRKTVQHISAKNKTVWYWDVLRRNLTALLKVHGDEIRCLSASGRNRHFRSDRVDPGNELVLTATGKQSFGVTCTQYYWRKRMKIFLQILFIDNIKCTVKKNDRGKNSYLGLKKKCIA